MGNGVYKTEWSVNFGMWFKNDQEEFGAKGLRLTDLPKVTREHIINRIKDGCTQGEFVQDQDPCDVCPNRPEVACRGCQKK